MVGEIEQGGRHRHEVPRGKYLEYLQMNSLDSVWADGSRNWLGFGFSASGCSLGRFPGPSRLCTKKPSVKFSGARSWTARFGGLKYEVDVSNLPISLQNSVHTIKDGAGTIEEYERAVDEVLAHRADYEELKVVLVDCLTLPAMHHVNAASRALEEVMDASLISPILSLLKGLNYSAQGEGLRLLGYFADPSVFLIMKDCAVDHLIPRCRRTACGVLASLNYDDKEDANDAYATLQLLVDCEDWTLRYAAIESLLNFKHMHFIEEDLKAKTPGIISGRLSDESEDSDLLKTKIRSLLESKKI
ncbi:hypothetical protein NDN08_001281 [Rhodosorus marinus]|uniref:Uncharacterized protein n=1 Tax=Rhodosorus marinus TaxID=101924 RepID=A0AAV8UQC4_9RHOD|nr:hypothetical protein NDN08_001281 [Rhodosorus marinus]